MFFCQGGKTRCGREEEYAHLKSYRTSRFHIHLSHACTRTQKKRTHFTPLPKATNGPDTAPKRQKNGSRQMTYKHTHMLALKTVPQKGLSIWRGWWREKKKTRKERKQFFNTHVWASIVQGRESTGWSRHVTHFFCPSKDVPMLNKMWRKQCLRTTTQSSSRQIFIPWKSWVIATEGAAR